MRTYGPHSTCWQPSGPTTHLLITSSGSLGLFIPGLYHACPGGRARGCLGGPAYRDPLGPLGPAVTTLWEEAGNHVSASATTSSAPR